MTLETQAQKNRCFIKGVWGLAQHDCLRCAVQSERLTKGLRSCASRVARMRSRRTPARAPKRLVPSGLLVMAALSSALNSCKGRSSNATVSSGRHCRGVPTKPTSWNTTASAS